MSKVLVTQEGEQVVQDILSTLRKLEQTIQDLDNRGKTLSNPDVWDGAGAREFRGQWPQMANTLRQLQDTLEQLSNSAKDIMAAIRAAGGGY
ncbi:MAG: WXG100 family type VII secretion target [Ardenticatenia bacterium]|nr:WXG100 family type VII secretion target [Ardenticatenia bacterium]